MLASVLTDRRPDLELADLDDPEPGAGEVVVEVTACGICGSDLHLASQMAEAGTVLGHEIAGTGAELGPGVDRRIDAGRPITETVDLPLLPRRFGELVEGVDSGEVVLVP